MAVHSSEDWQVIELSGDRANTWCYSYTQDAHYSHRLASIGLEQGSKRSQELQRLLSVGPAQGSQGSEDTHYSDRRQSRGLKQGSERSQDSQTSLRSEGTNASQRSKETQTSKGSNLAQRSGRTQDLQRSYNLQRSQDSQGSRPQLQGIRNTKAIQQSDGSWKGECYRSDCFTCQPTTHRHQQCCEHCSEKRKSHNITDKNANYEGLRSANLESVHLTGSHSTQIARNSVVGCEETVFEETGTQEIGQTVSKSEWPTGPHSALGRVLGPQNTLTRTHHSTRTRGPHTSVDSESGPYNTRMREAPNTWTRGHHHTQTGGPHTSVDSGIDTDNQDTLNLTDKHISKFSRIRDKQLELINKKKAELTGMIDKWSEQLTKQVEEVYTEEEERLGQSDPEDTDTLVLASMLTLENLTLPKTFGSFRVQHTLRTHMPDLATYYWAYQLGPSVHLRTFETRDSDLNDAYMASSVHLTPSGDVLVTDLGADTCRLFTREGRLTRELDTYPFDEPTHAISHGGGYLLSCREGLKRFSVQGKYVDTVADVKCPQCVSVDAKRGHVIVSDMYDLGTVIVTLHRDTLVPRRIMCGSQYQDDAVFTKAWHIHVTSDNILLLTDRHDHTLKAYGLHGGDFLWSVGGQGAKPGQLFNPAGITEDFLGNILVADCNNDRVQMWGGDGQWLGVVLHEGQISQPMDLVTDDTGNMYVLQGDGKVVVYRYLCEV